MKRLFALSLLALCLSISARADGFFIVPDCQYETGSGTSWQCTDISSYCTGVLSVGSSIDFIYKHCLNPSCGYPATGSRQCHHTGTIDIQYNCGGSAHCGSYLLGGYTKITCIGGTVSYDYYDCCTCSYCS